jgi:DNA helicase II / ATP-dependent DNA helicase PcrA
MMKKDFFELMKEETGKELNEVQRQAVLHTEGPLLLLASPGSGKTTTLNMKIAYLILEKNISPDAILGLTFSKAAAKDMEERFDSFFHRIIPQKVKFSTIHSFAFKIVREFFMKNGIPFQLIEGELDKEKIEELEEDFETILNKKIILRRLYQLVNGTPVTEEQMEELLRLIGYIKNKMLREQEWMNIETNVKNFVHIYKAYEEFKQKGSSKLLLDFDDMLVYANEILEKDTAILSKYQNQYEYILTDESQDTSLIQHEIIEKLARPKNNICVVGDDDQVLYSWRGADVQKLLHFKETYPNATILFMEQNYRSAKEIVDTANQFIQRNKARYPKNMFTENKFSGKIQIKELDTYKNQIEYLVEELKKTENLKETAILYRNNSSSINLIDALDKAGIPFYMKDSDVKFFQHWVLQDVLNFMRFSYNDKRVDLLERIYPKFNGYITKNQMEMLKQLDLDKEKSVFDNLMEHIELKDYQKKRLPHIKKLFHEMNASKPQEAIQLIRKELGYEKILERISENLGFNIDNLLEILDTLENIAENLQSLEEFAYRVKRLEEVMKTSKFNKRKNAVTLSTFHSSKGLEFDKVYMIDLINGVIPSFENIKDYKNGKREDMEESVRLFYVGMTRARKHLELITYKKKGKEKVSESMFVTDVRKILHPESTPSISLNTVVHHKKFGKGTVFHIDGDALHVEFENGLKKQLSFKVCLEYNILEIVS